MKDLKKIDDFDFVFMNKSLTQKEEKELSEFSKKRKLKTKNSKVTLQKIGDKKEFVL